MKQRIALLCSIASLLVLISSPVNAKDRIVNVCIHKKTGYIRQSAIATCLPAELPVGAKALTAGKLVAFPTGSWYRIIYATFCSVVYLHSLQNSTFILLFYM